MVVLVGRLEVVVVEARQLPNLDAGVLKSGDKSDPYCIVQVSGASGTLRLGKTHTIDDCLNPKWYYKINSDLQQDVSGLSFVVKDKDVLTSQVIGTASLSVHRFTGGVHFDDSLDLISPKGKPAGKLFISVKFSGTENAVGGGSSFQDRAKLKAGDISRRVSRGMPCTTANLTDSFSFSANDMASFLHGVLEVEIIEARNLPNLDSSLLSLSKKDVSDPFVVVTLEDEGGASWKVCTTSVVDNNLDPEWKETFRVDVCHNVISVTFTVKDKDFLSSETMGCVRFNSDELVADNTVSGSFDLMSDKKKKAGQLKLSITYRSKSSTVTGPEVPDTLYPLRLNNNVRLYQDAHCPHLPFPVFDLMNQPYAFGRAWLDLYNTINEAQHFIYIVGWSVSTKIRLLRWEGEDSRTLGEMLLHKANEGLTVCLLLWDELTSNDLRKQGAMSTEDEETRNFFKGSSVKVVLAPRDRYTKDMFSTKNSFTKVCYTHHQKVVIADAPNYENPHQRHVVAYVGGLDLTGGRFDSPNHPLFSTLLNEHKNDFRNKMFLSTSASGPREPWHDIHSRVEGPIALDLFANFEERWSKQGDQSVCLTKPLHSIQLDYGFHDASSWNVQMFRSINTDSAIFNWQTVIGDALTHKKGRAYDNSLHRAYIHQIRRSERFLYIENQYFLGSSHVWLNCRDAKAGNLVPLEITRKIEEKILRGEQYTAYITIPMFPEGKPADKVTQEILHWQFRTIEMMYSRVGAAIKQAGRDAHPQDYLLFFCLGKKEDRSLVPDCLVPPDDPAAAAAFMSNRLMIYVHSKMAIFDDEYIIVGSANINDRSLSGNRDTEIAVGAYQPYAGSPGTGKVGGFRRALWAEHLGHSALLYLDPSGWECARKMKEAAEHGLNLYLQNDGFPLLQHLLLYPLQVCDDGRVTSYPGYVCFPDTDASVIGARSKVLPSSLTT